MHFDVIFLVFWITMSFLNCSWLNNFDVLSIIIQDKWYNNENVHSVVVVLIFVSKKTKKNTKSLCNQQFKCEKLGVLRVCIMWFLWKLKRGSFCFFRVNFFIPHMYHKWKFTCAKYARQTPFLELKYSKCIYTFLTTLLLSI